MLVVFLHGCVMAMVLWPTEAGVSCGGILFTETGIIRSPGYPKAYPHNSSCVYNVLASPDARLKLSCSIMNIEASIGCINDYLKVNGIIYCGKRGPKKIYGEGQLRLEFISNGSNSKKKGFLCKFKRVTGDASVGCGVVNRQIRIVGGEETEIHEYPWQIIFLLNGSEWCGGSIVSRRWILTAAHCVQNRMTTTNTQVAVGEHDYNDADETPFTTVVGIEQIVQHPSYSRTTMDNDIALIKLKLELDFTQANRVAPVCLPPVGTQHQFENVDATISGWGLQSVGGSLSHVLYDVTVPTISNAQCQHLWRSSINITDNMICTGEPESNKGVYKGDSGGALITEAMNGRMIQIGVASFTARNLKPGIPACYARVTRYMPWILSYVDDAEYWPPLAE